MISQDEAEASVHSEPRQLPTAWGGFRWVGSKIYSGLETAGEYVADFLGLNDSHYQWAIDEYMKRKEEEEELAAEAEAEERARIAELEEGE
mmetsp:Transcript_66029/g.137573  ORF Transcript_66029/g.137573 Transcript_66029/m.137573 type:complete len:91 (-) Transcript_66029:541-813(-)